MGLGLGSGLGLGLGFRVRVGVRVNVRTVFEQQAHDRMLLARRLSKARLTRVSNRPVGSAVARGLRARSRLVRGSRRRASRLAQLEA